MQTRSGMRDSQLLADSFNDYIAKSLPSRRV
jgi:hypothetical protein